MSFVLTALIVEATPGPNMAWLALTSATAGRRAGLAAVAGIATGLTIIGAASAIGLTELAVSAPLLFRLMTYAGVAYLVWLAWSAWREAGIGTGHDKPRVDSALAWFRHGLVINLLNPKAAMFFVAILPTFVAQGLPASRQIAFLTAIYVVIATAAHLGIVAIAAHAHRFFENSARARTLGRMSALLLAGTALWVLITSHQV